MARLARLIGGVVMAATVLGGVTPAPAQNYAMIGGEKYFRLDWEPGERAGQPEVRGTVHNEWGETAHRIKLKVESLDPAGQVTATTLSDVPGVITPGTHAYFEIPVPAPAPAYRVSVVTWDWMLRRGGVR